MAPSLVEQLLLPDQIPDLQALQAPTHLPLQGGQAVLYQGQAGGLQLD